jgi:hypothetical protein
VDAVKRFQRRHGLDADGRLGSATIKQLNVPLRDRVLQIQVTLERWRWLPVEFSAPPIIVNIPDFRLRALNENNTVAMDMRVVVGKALRTQTPVFSRDMTYVVLRPYWNVPPGILRGEIVPAIQRDRGYIARKNYEVTTQGGEVVTSGEISDEVLAQLRAGKLTVRQKPGPANALGLVKLIFPNEHNVYLHSTPSQGLFSRSRRDFSHGCIRVEKPAELAAWVLRNNPGWTVEKVQQGMQSEKDNVTVSLAKPVPVSSFTGRRLPTKTVKSISPMTFTDTIPNWRRPWLRGIPTRNSGAQLPAPDAPHVHVHEIRSCVVADTTTMQRQGSVPQLCGGNPGHPNVDGHCLHVETVAGHAMSMSTKKFIAPRCAVAADDINLKIGISEGNSKLVQEVEYSRIVLMNLFGTVIAQISV